MAQAYPIAGGLPRSSGSSGAGAVPIIGQYNLFLGKPSAVTYGRADTCATRVDSSGNLVQCASGEYRLTHSASGIPLGCILEEARTNRCTTYNAVPVNTTGFVTSGDATISLVSDTTALTNAKLRSLVTGQVYRIQGGAAGGYVDIPGTIGSVSASSFSTYARLIAGTANLSHSGTSPGTKSITAATWQRYKLYNQIPSATTVLQRINVGASADVYIILMQPEVGVAPSTPIVTAGATATRVIDNAADTAFNTRAWFNASEMTILFEGTPFEDQYTGGSGTVRYQFYTGVDTVTEGIGIFAGGAKSMYSPLGIAPGAAAINAASPTNFEVGPMGMQETFSGISYKNGGTITAWADGFAHKTANFGTMSAANMARLSIGHRFSGAAVQSFNGIVRRIVVINRQLVTVTSSVPDMAAAAPYYELKARQFIIDAGQSNTLREMTEADVTGPSGHRVAIDEMNRIDGSMPNFLVNAAFDGSRLVKSSGAQVDYWVDPADNSFGPPMTQRWEPRVKAMLALGATCLGEKWDQGESDTGRTENEYSTNYTVLHTRKKTIVPGLKICMRRIGRRSDGGSGGTPNATYELQVQQIRNAQTALAAGAPTEICIAPEKTPQPLSDIVHLTQAGYAASSLPWIRKALKFFGKTVSGVVDPMYISNVGIVGQVITVNLLYDAAAVSPDFTGTLGCRFMDNGVNIAGTFLKIGANQFTFTLASPPAGGAGTRIFYFGYGSLYADFFAAGSEATLLAGLIKDNTTNTLMLRQDKFVLN